MKGGPKPIKLPADAVRELLHMAEALERELRTWPQKGCRNQRWVDGMRRGLGDAAKSCRRRASRIVLAQERQLMKHIVEKKLTRRDREQLKAFRKIRPDLSRVFD